MYSLDQIARGIKQPSRLKQEAHRRGWDVYNYSVRKFLYPEQETVVERDWDNLILLDACRYDLFEETSTLPGTLEKYYSLASTTGRFVDRTFTDEYPDIVMITATPKYTEWERSDRFFDVVQVWKTDWNEELRTVHPADMTEAVREAVERYPNKRIFAHYIPPHAPFIGETGEELEYEVVFSKDEDIISADTHLPNLWEAVKMDEMDAERVWEAYKENLEIALPHVESLLHELQGKTVVTADHGNAFGEMGVYGHPPERHIPELVKVPWLEYQNGDRKHIESGDMTEEGEGSTEDDGNGQMLKERLADLGYKT
ncbi:hypothetical protein [Halobacterium bonnevillei]|uniref:Uncharacterized protein n=1 Tax=Halobacterium bonnevillei TaxID=2692200 RepID=A0A6B0SBI9_9EURY|nr:hypothetical protein [Halobacterium bonnevillei]MXR19074.1 hypothetical protein [Halobacterium bonnevillei]